MSSELRHSRLIADSRHRSDRLERGAWGERVVDSPTAVFRGKRYGGKVR